MRHQELLELMKNHSNNLNELLSILHRMRAAVITSDYQNFESAIDAQEKILLVINNNESQRLQLLKDILQTDELPREELLKILCEKDASFDSEVKAEYLQIKEDISTATQEISLCNFENKQLINNSRNFIKDLITALYDIRKENLLDRKV